MGETPRKELNIEKIKTELRVLLIKLRHSRITEKPGMILHERWYSVLVGVGIGVVGVAAVSS